MTDSSSSSCTLLLKQVPARVLGDILSGLEIDQIDRDMELIEYLPMIRSRLPDLHHKVTDAIDDVCFKFGVDSIPVESRDPETGILTSMKRRVEIIESFRLLKLAHYDNCILGEDDPFYELPADIAEMILLEVLSNLKTDMDLLKVLPVVKKYLPSLHMTFISLVDPVKDYEPSMDVLKCMSKPELIEFMMERGVHASHRYSREMLLKECAREFERDATGLRMCTVESVHASYIHQRSASNSKDVPRYVSAMRTCLSKY